MFDTRKIFSIASGADFDQAALEVFRFQAGRLYTLSGISLNFWVSTLPEWKLWSRFRSCRSNCSRAIGYTVVLCLRSKCLRAAVRPGEFLHRRYVADLAIYEEAFTRAFELFYGPVQKTSGLPRCCRIIWSP